MQSPGVAEPSYQAPFSRGVPLGAVGHERPRLGFADQQTLRYRGDATGLSVSINGLRGETRVTAPGAFVFDAPFMTAPLFVVAFAPEMLAVTPRAVIGTPRFAKIPKSDAIVQFPGMADLWYDRGNYIVHEARFLRLNVDARTVRTATDGDGKTETRFVGSYVRKRRRNDARGCGQPVAGRDEKTPGNRLRSAGGGRRSKLWR